MVIFLLEIIPWGLQSACNLVKEAVSLILNGALNQISSFNGRFIRCKLFNADNQKIVVVVVSILYSLAFKHYADKLSKLNCFFVFF